MAHLGSTRYVKKLRIACDLAEKLGHSVYMLETARTWEVVETLAGQMRGRLYVEVGTDRRPRTQRLVP